MKRWGWGIWCTIILTAFTIAYGFWVKRLEWGEQASFDILGILYLLSNVPNLVAWGLMLVFMALTIWAWVLVIWLRPSADHEWVAPDELGIPIPHADPSDLGN